MSNKEKALEIVKLTAKTADRITKLSSDGRSYKAKGKFSPELYFEIRSDNGNNGYSIGNFGYLPGYYVDLFYMDDTSAIPKNLTLYSARSSDSFYADQPYMPKSMKDIEDNMLIIKNFSIDYISNGKRNLLILDAFYNFAIENPSVIQEKIKHAKECEINFESEAKKDFKEQMRTVYNDFFVGARLSQGEQEMAKQIFNHDLEFSQGIVKEAKGFWFNSPMKNQIISRVMENRLLDFKNHLNQQFYSVRKLDRKS